MKTQHRRLVIACLVCLSLGGAGRSQDTPRQKSAPGAATPRAGRRAPATSPEEKVVRAVYEKLTAFSRAASRNLDGAADRPVDESLVLKFELGGFRVGPVHEIWNTPDRDIATLPSGDILRVGRVVRTLNKGPEHVGYEGQWARAN